MLTSNFSAESIAKMLSPNMLRFMTGNFLTTIFIFFSINFVVREMMDAHTHALFAYGKRDALSWLMPLPSLPSLNCRLCRTKHVLWDHCVCNSRRKIYLLNGKNLPFCAFPIMHFLFFIWFEFQDDSGFDRNSIIEWEVLRTEELILLQ